MALVIQWIKRADKKFTSIIEYLDKEWGKNVTKRFIKKDRIILLNFFDNRQHPSEKYYK
ncbi:hypothetical protein SDC9_74468 [bioreactor metagenome]|uniref:Uncharacterized protein n=1 Tax=bioreactor metagenome TaxID=1076179 RepID=A0A644YJ81_9ZZZZ